MVFSRFVQVGRIVTLKNGPQTGSPAVIVEIVDHNRVLIDGPLSGVKRQVAFIRHIKLTGIVIKLPRSARTSTVQKHLEKFKAMETFNASTAAKSTASKKRRALLTDFERFQKRAILTGGLKASKK